MRYCSSPDARPGRCGELTGLLGTPGGYEVRNRSLSPLLSTISPPEGGDETDYCTTLCCPSRPEELDCDLPGVDPQIPDFLYRFMIPIAAQQSATSLSMRFSAHRIQWRISAGLPFGSTHCRG
jgi:hypothetical protein